MQRLLNSAQEKTGCPTRAVVENGRNSPELVQAIREFQTRSFGSSDLVVDPGQRTIQRLNAIAASLTVVQDVLRLVPTCLSYANAALATVTRASSNISAGISTTDLGMVYTHFHCQDELSHLQLARLTLVSAIYKNMISVLSEPADRFASIPNQPDGRFAEANLGGMSATKGTNAARIRVCPNFSGVSDYSKVGILLHELGHFCGSTAGPSEIGHYAYTKWGDKNGYPAPGRSRNYEQLLPSETILNAETYKAFAVHAGTRNDTR